MFNRSLYFIIKLTVSITLISLLVYNLDSNKIVTKLSNLNYIYIYLSTLFYIIVIYTSTLRWKYLLKVYKINIPFSKALNFFLVGSFFNIVTPSTIGGDAYRIYDLSNYSKQSVNAFSSVVVDRWTGLSATFFISFIALILGGGVVKDTKIFLLIITSSVVFAVFSLLVFSNFINNILFDNLKIFINYKVLGFIIRSLQKISESLREYSNNKKVLLNAFGISIIIKLFTILISYLLALSIGINISVLYFLIYVPIIIILTTIPLSIGGIGIREASFIYFFTKAGVNSTDCFSLSILVFLWWAIVSIVPGIIIFIFRK